MSQRPGRMKLANSKVAFSQVLKTTVAFTFFELKKMSAGFGLGIGWLFIEPFLKTMIYVFVFTIVLGARLPGEDSGTFAYAVYILMGLVPWLYISSVVNDGVMVIHTYAGFIRQPNFPYHILPNVLILKHLPAHIIGMAIVFFMMISTGDLGKINFPLLIIVYILLIAATSGIASVLGALAAIVPDIRTIVPILLMLLIYLSPILYLPEQLGKGVVIALVNPFSYMLTSFKFAITGEERYVLLSPFFDLLILFCLAVLGVFSQRWVLSNIRKTGIDRVV